MPRVPPNSGRFKKGQVANPRGAGAHNLDVRRIRRLTHDEVAQIGDLLLQGNIEGLEAIRNDPNSSVLKIWFSAVILRAIDRGDVLALSAILDRIVGKIKDHVVHSGEIKTDSNAAREEAKLIASDPEALSLAKALCDKLKAKRE